MSSLALAHLIVAGDASARRRLVGVVAGVTLGTALLLMILAASQSVGVRAERSTWHELITTAPTYLEPGTELSPDQAAAVSASDHYGDRTISVLTIATAPGTTVRVPGSDVVPGPGEYLASPALTRLIAASPADQLGERYGTQVGTISDDALEGPDSLVLVRGAEQAAVERTDSSNGPQLVTGFAGYDYQSQTYRVVAVVGAVAILVPVLLLIGIITDLGAAQRAERFATLRLIGAAPGRVAAIAAAETAATSLLGSVAGTALYLALIPLAARVRIGSSTFFPSDLLTSPATVAGTVLATVACSTAVAWWRTRRADLGPLGGSRERSERRPRTVGLLPLVLGVIGMAASREMVDSEVPATLVLLTIVSSVALTMVGLLLAGPLLTSWAARAGQRRARTSAQVIALARVAQHPRSAFRSVGGLVAALYAVTLFAVGITAASGVLRLDEGPGHLRTTTLAATADLPAPAAAESARSTLEQVEGVSTVAVATLAFPQDGEDETEATQALGTQARLVLPVEQARALGAQDAGSATGWVSVSVLWLTTDAADPRPTSPPESPGAAVVLVATDGTTAAVERARTALTTSGLPLTTFPTTRADVVTLTAAATENQFAALGYIGILIATGVSAVSLSVASVASVLDRRRVLSLLRLVGMPRKALRRTIAWESLLPLSTVLGLSVAVGAYTAWALVTGLSAREVGWPGGSYYAVVGACLVLVGAAVTASARAGERMVSGSTVRFE
ncbi:MULTISPECIES: FtsX-like permease family protein [unclassified Actinomyces]|uniref:FtsX-like permease family protein n=1 Tax=unclassified Actinomyces TaxID=2609248 RepID=UPI0020182300|nr:MULTISPECIES: FtsX-like permease family protein [unclassified Actinomyces]MCL3778395.1 ABC transporter permease [Actinomyces sp. AC-20-1]MCL3790066.1 ABC transporter permease [Actinomyces sp. 187325]MCL3792333.1 ABC transporter permease [Actinomyces sp. 186855]MCL3794911.1 ABC transporter permease [Actinomyces sp. 217892]